MLVDAVFIGLLEASPLILAAMGFTLIFYLARVHEASPLCGKHQPTAAYFRRSLQRGS